MQLGHVYFYVLTLFLAVDVLRVRKINLLHVWVSAFIFIILSEINTSAYLAYYENILTTSQFFLLANNMVILGYFSNSKQVIGKQGETENTHNKLRKSALFFMIGLTVLYVVNTFPFAIKSYVFGRAFAVSESGGGFVDSIISSLAYVLPATYAYYFMKLKKPNLVWPLLLSIPIWFLLFLIGTRFHLLFSVLGLVIVGLSLRSTKLSTKNYVFLGLGAIMFLLTSIMMKQSRTGLNPQGTVNISLDDSKRTLPQKVGAFGSNELVVDITTKLLKYYEDPTVKHQYGKASSFILYFWVPRAIWPDKPTMLGYWFIRKVKVVSENHSASLGFTGELFVDFGYFSLIVIFLIGWALKSSENFFIRCTRSKSLDLVIGAMFYPMIFFFVRSPVTSLMSFIGILALFFILKKFFYQSENKAEVVNQVA